MIGTPVSGKKRSPKFFGKEKKALSFRQWREKEHQLRRDSALFSEGRGRGLYYCKEGRGIIFPEITTFACYGIEEKAHLFR
jgi:hypothetical protein